MIRRPPSATTTDTLFPYTPPITSCRCSLTSPAVAPPAVVLSRQALGNQHLGNVLAVRQDHSQRSPIAVLPIGADSHLSTAQQRPQAVPCGIALFLLGSAFTVRWQLRCIQAHDADAGGLALHRRPESVAVVEDRKSTRLNSSH